MGNPTYVDKLKELETRIIRLEDAVDAGETLSSVELLKLKDELYRLKLAYVQQDKLIESLEDELEYYRGYSEDDHNTFEYTYPESTEYYTDKVDTTGNTVKAKVKHKAERMHIKDRISFDVSKLILPILAAILILLSSVVFVGAFWENIPDAFKSGIIVGVGVFAYILGLNLYNKSKLYPYIILGAIGSAVMFVGIVSAGVVFNTMGEIPTIISILIWAMVNLLSYFKLQHYGLLGVTELGILVASFLVCDKTAGLENESAWFMWVVVLILALTPAVINYIKDCSKYVSPIYSWVTHSSALVSLGMFMLASSDRRLLDYIGNSLYTIDSILVVVTAMIICIILTKIGSISNIIVYPLNHLVTLILITASMLVAVVSLNWCVSEQLAYTIYLLMAAIIALRNSEYELNYTFVVPHILAGVVLLAGSVFESTAFPWDLATATMAIILGILMVIHTSISKIQLEKTVTALAMMVASIGLLTTIMYEDMGFIYFSGTILVAAVTIGLIEYKAMCKDYLESRSAVPTIIFKVAVDILGFASAIVFGAAVNSSDVAIILAVAFLVVLRALDFKGNKLLQTVYNAELYLATIFIFALAESAGYEIAILMVLINLGNIMVSTLTKDGYPWTRIVGTIATIVSIAFLEDLIGIDDQYIVNISVLLMSAVMILLGFIFKHKTVRITSLVSLIVCTVSLVMTLASGSSTIEKAALLLVSGIFVLGISVVYAKFERKYALVNETEET